MLNLAGRGGFRRRVEPTFVRGGVQRGVRRCTEGCGGVCRDARRLHRGLHGGAWRGVQRCMEVVALATIHSVGDNREFEV